MKKIAAGTWSVVGYNLANKYYQDELVLTMLKMNDYLPLEIKRALQDKDFRHIALFDPDEARQSRMLFDSVTGKSLS